MILNKILSFFVPLDISIHCGTLGVKHVFIFYFSISHSNSFIVFSVSLSTFKFLRQMVALYYGFYKSSTDFTFGYFLNIFSCVYIVFLIFLCILPQRIQWNYSCSRNSKRNKKRGYNYKSREGRWVKICLWVRWNIIFKSHAVQFRLMAASLALSRHGPRPFQFVK